MPFDAEIAEIDLSEPGDSLTIYFDSEELEGDESLGQGALIPVTHHGQNAG
jgi:hypothetical protein